MSDQQKSSDQPAQQPEQPARLQSLASRGRGGSASARGGRGGRGFMPNAVSRRTKEERESSAPAIKQPKQEPQTGKFERKKPRQFGTRGEAAGPLAAPIYAPKKNARGTTGTRDSSSTPSQSVNSGQGPKIKSEEAIEAAQAQFIESDEGRVDISSEVNENSFFPLRISTQTAEDLVNKENEDVYFANDQLTLLQLPNWGLKAGLPPRSDLDAKVKDEEPADLGMDTSAMDVDQIDQFLEPKDEPEEKIIGDSGLLGTLRTHASGKMTMLINGRVYDIMAGSDVTSCEDIWAVDRDQRTAGYLGGINKKLVVVPDLSDLGI